jgi:hypothetical protein
MDGVLTAGQVSLMLDAKPTATWENLVGIETENVDDVVVGEMMCTHKSGVRYIASPRYPIAADTFSNETLRVLMERIKSQAEFRYDDPAADDVQHDPAYHGA